MNPITNHATSWVGRLLGVGRGTAILALVIVLASQIGFSGSVFSGPRLALFDSYERLVPRIRKSAPVVIVAVDEASLAAYGQWPWPRQLMAKLVGKILGAHPAALGIDMIWPEPDATSPGRWIKQQEGLSPALRSQLLSLPDHDALLAQALARGPVAIGVAGQRDGSMDQPGPLVPVRLIGGTNSPLLPSFTSMLRSLPILDQAAAGHGLLSADPDRDGMVRRVPLLSLVASRYAPALSTETLRLAVGAPWIDLRLAGDKAKALGLSGLTIPVQDDGTLWVDFSPHDARRFVSAADVLNDRLPSETFDQRLVLLGVTGLGLIDHFTTPVGVMPGVEVHAQVMENVFDGRFAIRPSWAPQAEVAATLLVGLIMIIALPLLGLRWQAPAAIFLLSILLAVGFGLWATQRWLIDVAAPITGDGIVFVALLAGTLTEMDRQRRRLRRDLEQQRLAAATMEGELAAAFRIQMGILPQPSGLKPDRRFNLQSQIVPAKHVGGDLYDFFMIDDDHLFIAIGDVSGKGVPASLFMAVGKALCKSCALRDEVDIGEIIQRANAEISRDNVEMLFITLFAGVLDLRSGVLKFCNAGHDTPFLIDRTGLVSRVPSVGGPPLCVMDDFPYTTESIELSSGEILCLVTDGVTEAMDSAGALMGCERIEAALMTLPPGCNATEAATKLQGAVAQFVGTAPPSDDLTLLIVQWTGVTAP